MSVQEILDFHKTLVDWIENPRAWLVQANPVWGSTETINRIAIFDTREGAEKYVDRSRLPEEMSPEERRTKDGYTRSFRPDSLLWNYNPDEYFSRMIVPAIPWHDYSSVTQNPEPPSGLCPSISALDELDDISTKHPRYGKDFDVGRGGPYTNMDDEKPEKPL